jgi:hypothetical protein
MSQFRERGEGESDDMPVRGRSERNLYDVLTRQGKTMQGIAKHFARMEARHVSSGAGTTLSQVDTLSLLNSHAWRLRPYPNLACTFSHVVSLVLMLYS